MIDQDIYDSIKAAADYAARLPAELRLIGGEDSLEEVKLQLGLVYRMGTELRRQVDHLHQVLRTRENGR